MVQQQKKGGTAMVLAGATLWGLIGLFNRTLMAAGLTPESIVLVRNLGGLFLLGLVLALGKPKVFHVQPKHLVYFFGTGIVSVLLFTWCYFSCQQECALAVAAILLYTSPTFVVLLSALLWKDKLTGKKLLALGLTFFGCICVTGVYSGSMTITLHGFLLGLGAGFFYALYSVFGRYALAHYEPYTVTFYTFAFAGVGSLIFFRTEQIALLAKGNVAIVALGLAVVCTVLPYLFYTVGLARMDSGKAAILASVEPMVAALVGIVVFRESMSPATGVGVISILAAVLLLR